ncbi:MAG: divalent-cation tolerance protein CutA [Fidelibacterota bacterium]
MVLLIQTTVNKKQIADRLAGDIVRNHLAACVNIVPDVTSVYRWKSEIVTETECLLFIKTTEDKLESLKKYMSDHHPYEVPEFAVFPLEHLNQDYLHWLTDAVND